MIITDQDMVLIQSRCSTSDLDRTPSNRFMSGFSFRFLGDHFQPFQTHRPPTTGLYTTSVVEQWCYYSSGGVGELCVTKNGQKDWNPRNTLRWLGICRFLSVPNVNINRAHTALLDQWYTSPPRPIPKLWRFSLRGGASDLFTMAVRHQGNI